VVCGESKEYWRVDEFSIQPVKFSRIVIILPDMGGGGAERLHVNLANDWVAKKLKVEFVLLRGKGDLISLLAPEIEVKTLNVDRIRDAVLPLAVYLRKSRPDVVIAAMWPLTSAVVFSWLLSGRVGKLILSEHENLSQSYIGQSRAKAGYVKNLIRYTYPLASGIVAVSHGVKKDLCFLGSLSANKVRVIHNPAAVGLSHFREGLGKQTQLWGAGCDWHVLSVGRLSLQKDHGTLIRAFALLPKDLKVKLFILGEGPLRAELSELISELGLQEHVSLPGYSEDIYQWFRTADLFVLSSRWEGFGNVIVEALECGVPVVSTNCPSGPDEILENGRYGKLVPVQDPVALAKAIVQSLNEIHDRETLMLRAQDFSVGKISEEYLSYIFQ
jgi:glycosyltransferase involved in cell wall biosynthesis